MLLITGSGWLGCAFWAHLHCSWQVYSFLPRLLLFLLLFCAFSIAFLMNVSVLRCKWPTVDSLGFDITSGTFCVLLLCFLYKYCSSPSFRLRLCLSVHLCDLIIINVNLNVTGLPFQLCSRTLAFMKIKFTSLLQSTLLLALSRRRKAKQTPPSLLVFSFCLVVFDLIRMIFPFKRVGINGMV